MMWRNIIFFILILAIGSGCSEQAVATHPVYYLATQCRESGDYEAAAVQLRKFLIMQPNSPEGHLALASLYDENLGDSLRAIYHYKEYLNLVTDSEDIVMVERWLQDATKRYQESLIPRDLAPITSDNSDDKNRQFVALQEQNMRLMRKIVSQRQEIDTLRKSTPEVAPPQVEAMPKLTSNQEYIVKSGDTLGMIARRFYGSSSRFNEIMKANNLSDTRLRIGQKLIIVADKED